MAFATKCAAAVAVGSVAFFGISATSVTAQPAPGAVCQRADSLLRNREIEKARDAYMDLLEDSGPQCAIDGLQDVAVVKRQESHLCEQGAELAASDHDASVRKYVAALRENTESECALAGLAPLATDDPWSERIPNYLPKFPVHLGAVLLMLLVLIAIGSIATSLIFRKASLVVRPFTDGAVNPKVGAGFSALVEEQLIGVWRRERRVRDDGYNLDFVVANVELFSDEDALSRAVGEMAQVDQLQLIAAVLSFVDNLGFKRRLAATGELLPAGAQGSGVALALYNRRQLEARGVLWDYSAAATPAPEDSKESANASTEIAPAETDSPKGVTPYYQFAGPAAAWVQYEAALALDSRVGVITSKAESFSLLCTAIELHRSNSYAEAAETYAKALEIDPNNVAALINFALLLARSGGLFPEAIVLLKRAQSALANAYAERP